eukprot:2407688-Pyramimonas_sp.AAC.1
MFHSICDRLSLTCHRCFARTKLQAPLQCLQIPMRLSINRESSASHLCGPTGPGLSPSTSTEQNEYVDTWICC